MKTFDQLLTILNETGFKSGIKDEPGIYFYLAGFEDLVLVNLDTGSYITISQDKLGYTVHFYYHKTGGNFSGKHGVFGKQVKKLYMKIEELENLLLTSIIRGSFLTEEEENKVMEDTQNISWSISWTQCTSKT
jgi:hypothetical protein